MSHWKDPMRVDSTSLPSTNPFGNLTVVDAVPEDILHLVDDHWYQFPPMNPLWYGLLMCFMIVMGCLSLAGNFVVIWVFTNSKPLHSPANLLVVNLAFSDFLLMLTLFPPMALSCYWHMWILGPFFCQLYGFFGSLFGCVSIWSMVWITLDRYNVIVKGMSATPLKNSDAVLRIAGTWLASIAWCLPPFFGWNRYVPEGNMTACGTDYLNDSAFSQSYLYLYSVFVYFAPLFITVHSYFFIVKSVAAHEKAMRDQAKKMGIKSLRNEQTTKTSAEYRLAKVAMTTVALWFIAWTPYLVINYAGMLNKSVVSPLFSIWGSVFAKANAVYNPIVYAISHPKYRAALEKKLPCLSCKSEDKSIVESTHTSVIIQVDGKPETA